MTEVPMTPVSETVLTGLRVRASGVTIGRHRQRNAFDHATYVALLTAIRAADNALGSRRWIVDSLSIVLSCCNALRAVA